MHTAMFYKIIPLQGLKKYCLLKGQYTYYLVFIHLDCFGVSCRGLVI